MPIAFRVIANEPASARDHSRRIRPRAGIDGRRRRRSNTIESAAPASHESDPSGVSPGTVQPQPPDLSVGAAPLDGVQVCVSRSHVLPGAQSPVAPHVVRQLPPLHRYVPQSFTTPSGEIDVCPSGEHVPAFVPHLPSGPHVNPLAHSSFLLQPVRQFAPSQL